MTQGADPYAWTSEEAVLHLQHNFAGLARHMSDNELDGRALLEDVDHALLENTFGIVRLMERIAIMRTIRELRQASFAYAASLRPGTLTLTLPPTLHPSDPQTPTPLNSTRVRKGEELVEDSRGHKRRKLTLASSVETTLEDAQPGASQSPVAAVKALQRARPPGFLPDHKHTVDEIFYSDTKYGSEIKHDEDEDDDSYDNFTIFGQSEFPGTTSFVYRRLRHAFQHSDPQPVTYHQNPSLAVYSYPERLLEDKDVRSVTVFETSESGIKAIRERAQTLPFQKDEAVDNQMSPGDFSYLLNRHTESDELLPTYGESDYGSDSAEETHTNVEDSASGSDDDMAEEDSCVETPIITQERVKSLIDKSIEIQTQAWRANQQPKLDKHKARSVWRLGKGNRKTVRALTRGAIQAVERLNGRLARLKQNLTDRSWESEQEVEQACVSLEPTVHDREQEEWKIRTWALKVEPVTTTRHRKPSDRGQHGLQDGARAQEMSDGDINEFIVDDESFEYARENLLEDDSASESGIENQGMPSQKGSQDEKTPTDEVDADVIMTADANFPDATEVPADFQYIDEPRGELLSSELPESTADAVDLEPVQTPTNNKFTVGMPVEPDSPGLPSLDSVLRKSQRSSTRNHRKDVITISSSPVRPGMALTTQSSPSKKFDIKEEQEEKNVITYSDNPDTDTVREILKWTYEGLEAEEDRRRLMIKMAFHLDDAQRDPLVRLFTGNVSTCLEKTKDAIAAIRKGSEVFDGYSDEESEAMRYAARLYLCFCHIDHRFFSLDVSELKSLGYEWMWDGEEKEFAEDLRRWYNYLWQALKRFKNAQSTGEIETIIIDDSDDEQNEKSLSVHTSARKRLVKQDQGGVRKRVKAAERAKAYDSQNQYNQTGSFMAGDDGETEVALHTPSDLDPQKHVYLNPTIAKRLKPHQVEGVKFMWREITAPEDEDGQGCLLAHTMGLGKTAQSLALITAVAETARDIEKRDALPSDLKKAKDKLRVLVLCPPSLMTNWRQEIKMWCPEKLFLVFSLSSEVKDKAMRLNDLKDWRKYGGIMLCGYTMFTRLVNNNSNIYDDDEQRQVLKFLLRKPHIVIADEVHSIKSNSSKSSLAAHKILTQRRIGLTGSPMSNNTSEIFALINWVAPNFLGHKEEFKAHYQEPIEAGTYYDSKPWEVRKSMTKLAALKKIISPKLNRADITVLQGSLKRKVEFVLTIPLTESQKLGYMAYVKEILRGKVGEEGSTITQVKLFGWLAILQLLCNHPIVFRRKLLEPATNSKRGKKVSLLVAENGSTAGSPIVELPVAMDPTAAPPSTAVAPSGTAQQREGQSPSRDEDAAYADAHISQYDIDKAIVDALLEVVPDNESIELSNKTVLVRRIMNLSIEAGDKVLIFSQSIPSLNFLDKMLKSMGLRYGRIQGDMALDKREKVLKAMANGELDVLLISTRAGGLGLNIQQANRVIIFDFAFNPTWEEQAIGRAYRLGQTKPVFVYRFVAGGTFEYSLYDKQLFKTGLASRVVDKKNPMRNANRKPADWLKPPHDVLQQDIYAEAGKDEHVMDKIIIDQLEGHDKIIRSIKTMETLMEESKDEALTAEEMQEAENEVLLAKTRKMGNVFESRAKLLPPPPPGLGPREPRPYGPGFDFTPPGPSASSGVAAQALSTESTGLTGSPSGPSQRLYRRY
ncbi:hypothetical protein AUEXF2481DRAFT_38344 [Aureobasidium subglaciale EXF-2481]|uniref:Helicase C-terminal domain-containing protein n=1 Tax=Aureobasidium subglaciale (strain EXF-2481) TaxID=1043005 RepID=A0A074YGH9_AURSE|nr:uncharacterized protein AUEXF2481DRAFT_38344 [Aureobasidium subglaciale EXF-2481]KAI5198721.1 hypothetical protein E4T38_07370 [Aureobasidium subglaciale]KAI5217418.1 hypothetical protein E4T40_07381 [Aureobasidium subglaciale]KAI5221042.1 hypothetical protein E4T41_07222 [Aureobasidium subglaciale]KAI5258593.1 hypothetical protein E4T46_07199 [Aureobasidium subglaciale]KEQ96938.1 hypothetical protein AUEXF2481DRAFT_38344 [Aureobasidium subglaciale EXF-2481]